MFPPGNFGFDPSQLQQLQQQYQQYLPQQPASPQQGPQAQPLPPVQAPTQPAPPQRGPLPPAQGSQFPVASPGQPAPIAPASAPAAARSPQQTIESWHRFVGSQGLQQTRPGFFGTGGMSLQDMVARFNQSTGGQARIVGPDKVDFGFGPVDVVTNSKSGQGMEFWFNPSDVPGYRQPGGGGGGRPSGGGGGGVAGGAIGSTGGGKNIDPMLRDAILRLMQRGEAPVGDMSGDPRSRAYAAARERSANQQRASAAERAAFQGLNLGGQGSGSFETTLGGIQESAGRDIAGQQAGLVGEEIAARRQDLLNALNLAESVGARDQATAIRLQLANMDQQFRYSQLGQQQSQFNDQYGLSRLGLQYQMDRDAMLAALGG